MRYVRLLAATIALAAAPGSAQDRSGLRDFTADADTPRGDDTLDPNVDYQASAPPLTSVAVYGVFSTQNGGWEITYNKFTTTGDHGGAQLRVAFEEWGYGQNRVAKFNGAVLPASAQFASDPICGGTPANPNLNCPAGSTIIGFIRYYKLDGQQSGSFQAQSTSINAPIRTYSTSITIR